MQLLETVGGCCAKRYGEVLTPSTSERDLIWKLGLYRGNQLKISSLGWALIITIGKNREIWTQRKTGTEERQCEDTQGEDGHMTREMHLQAKEHQGLPANTRS